MGDDSELPIDVRALGRLFAAGDPILFDAGRGPAAAADLRSADAFFRQRSQSGPKVRVRAGADGRRHVVELLNDDRPFLVDSVLAELQGRQVKIAALAHPIVHASRDAGGILTAMSTDGGSGRAESWIVAEIETLSPPDAAALEASLVAVMADVAVATTDFEALQGRVKAAAEAVADPIDRAFLTWLLDGHFVFLAAVGGAPGATPLGLARQDPLLLATAQVDARLRVAKSDRLSPVHRRVPLDVVTVPTPGAPLILAGLFTSKAYTATARSIPLLRDKIERVLALSGFPPASHGGKALVNILDTFPRDELFQIETETLTTWARRILDLEIRPRLRLFVRHETPGRTVSVLLYAPRDAWTTRARARVSDRLGTALGGRVVSYQPFFLEGAMLRAHFLVERESGASAALDVSALEAELAEALRTFDDRLAAALENAGADAAALRVRYTGAFPPDYTEVFSAGRALEDIRRIEQLRATAAPASVDFYRPDGLAAGAGAEVAVAVSRFGAPIQLSDRVPVLENLGFTVIDERTYALTPRVDGAVLPLALHHMRLVSADGTPIDLARDRVRLEDAFAAVMSGAAENDVFNRLVAKAGATWREAALMRAYAGYLRQLVVPFGLRALGETLAQHGGITRDLLELFHTRLDPEHRAGDLDARRAAAAGIRTRIEGALGGVASLDEDRMLRLFLATIDATVRTNVYRRDAGGQPPAEIALKFDPAAFDAVPTPRPYREIWVSSPRVDGVHLRFAPIARGGLRWSDRAGDFRTEVLGLVRAQQVKNAVIVPSGAKGGFVPKKLPRAGTRDEIAAEGVAAYKRFINALLDVTDNIVDGRTVPPPHVVRHDGDDPYLVVAADKGTATFSDVANGISAERGHWLGDAFASGGSVGYDHKKMGITARGAWECVKRHFRERDIDIQTMPFTVAGVGDMSGDVFGNGMLLSRAIRLIAAFDHRDIFIDPEPDAASSFAERERMFALPRSSWQDYDKSQLSAGGLIISRAAKRVTLTPQAQARLALAQADVTPADILRAILSADVDLLWFGGIGTYIRASTETDEQVGDRANDAIRLSAQQVRAKAIGEGANLALTQRGRIELHARSCRLNTDFIDNSAGVNSSDLEVNIKIALGPAVARGALPPAERAAFLATLTEGVARRCLAANHGQSLAISLAERQATRGWRDFAALMRHLERRGLLDRALEALPDETTLEARTTAGRPLTRPELAVLTSYAKIALTADLLASTLPDLPLAQPLLAAALPDALSQAYSTDVAAHPLRREIIATAATNSLVNRLGASGLVTLAVASGRRTSDVALAAMIMDEACGFGRVWAQIDAQDGRIGGTAQLDLYTRVQAAFLAATRSLATTPAALADPAKAVAMLHAAWQALPAAEAGTGSTTDLSAGVASLIRTDGLWTIATLAADANVPMPTAQAALQQVVIDLRTADLTRRAAMLVAVDPYEARVQADALATLRQIDQAEAARRLRGGVPAHSAALAQVDAVLAESKLSLAGLIVATEALRAAHG